MSGHSHDSHESKFGPKQILYVFAFLSAVTALEFIIAFTVGKSSMRNWVFIILTVIKAAGIMGYFMHLKF